MRRYSDKNMVDCSLWEMMIAELESLPVTCRYTVTDTSPCGLYCARCWYQIFVMASVILCLVCRRGRVCLLVQFWVIKAQSWNEHVV